MRETIKEYETVEKEVEKVYCDRCNSECTGEAEIEPRELCPDCQTGDEDDGHWTQEVIYEWNSMEGKVEVTNPPSYEVDIALAVCWIILFPVFFGATFFDYFLSEPEERTKEVILAIIGCILWTLFAISAYIIFSSYGIFLPY